MKEYHECERDSFYPLRQQSVSSQFGRNELCINMGVVWRRIGGFITMQTNNKYFDFAEVLLF